MRFFIKVILQILLIHISIAVSAQKDIPSLRAMFYNTENLFDTIDDPSKEDDEFLLEGAKKWNNYRYWKKINSTFKVIAAAGSVEPPEIIGLCEVEGFLPLYHLCYNTPLVKYPYAILQYETSDRRGISTALLIRTDKIKVLDSQKIEVVFPWDTIYKTRDILCASLQIQSDTLFVFINHWPSRRGGQLASEPYRLKASEVLGMAIDSVRQLVSDAQILVMGDFNDEPKNNSLKQLAAQSELTNLSADLAKNYKGGTYRYHSYWNMLDQALVSSSLFEKKGVFISRKSLHILNEDFLLMEEKKYGGFKPKRTYLGPRYLGGYSDHLPIVVDFYFNTEK